MKISAENNKELITSVNIIQNKEKRGMQNPTKIALVISAWCFFISIIFFLILILFGSFVGFFLGLFFVLPIGFSILIIVPTLTWIIMRIKKRRKLISSKSTSVKMG